MWNWVERELYVKPGPLNPEKPRVQSLLSSYVTLSKLKAIYPQIGDNFWFCFHRLKWGNHTYIIVALNESNVMAYIKYMVSTIWNTVVLVIYWCVPNHSRIQVHKTTVSITLIILWIKNSGRHRQNRESLLHDAYGFRVGDLNSRDGCDNLTGTMPKSPWFWLFAQVFGGSLQGADWGWNIILYYFSLIHLVSGLAGQNTAKQARHPFFSLRACWFQGLQALYNSWLIPNKHSKTPGYKLLLTTVSATVPDSAQLQWEETPPDEKSGIHT